MSESWLNASAWLGLSVLNQGGTSCFLALEGPPGVTFKVVQARGIPSTVSGEGCHPLGLGDCSGASVGGAVEVSHLSTGEVLCGGTSGGDGGVCPNKIW